MGLVYPSPHMHTSGFVGIVRSVNVHGAHVYVARATLASRVLPLRRPAARKNLSVEAGNAIEVITSLITTLHAIRDREFVFHERTASTVHPFPVLTSPTLAFPSRACVHAHAYAHTHARVDSRSRSRCTQGAREHLHVRITYAAGLSVHK